MKILAFLLLLPLTALAVPPAPDKSYVVVVSQATNEDPAWKGVVHILTEKHKAPIAVYKNPLENMEKELARAKPRYTCFVAKPEEATRSFVQSVHRLTRRYDDDPYTDTFWGILTGYDAENAKAIAMEEKPLTIQKTGSGTEVALDRCEAGTWYCELRKGHMMQKTAADDVARLVELDRFWNVVSQSVKDGDFDGYKATCHPEGVLVTEKGKTSYPLTKAFERWKAGFDDTKAGRAKASVEFRFSQRLGDGTTAHETGIFLYSFTDAQGQSKKDYVRFEALLIKRDGWKVLMEYQKSPATAEEWAALKPTDKIPATPPRGN